ncbi:MAG: integrase arm-type DNA-binding domain-containing protein [Sphingobium sp.]
MARALNRLTVRQVQTLKEVGRHADGGGLYLRITNKGAKAWVFMAKQGDKRIEIGLGSAGAVTLAKAREIAMVMREAVATGADVRRVLLSEAPPKEQPTLTFGAFSDDYIAGVEEGWRNAVHRQQWRNSLRDHAHTLRDKPLPEITTDDLLEVLRPIWIKKAETAKRVRGRIEKILNAAKAQGLLSRDAMNPATWRGHLEFFLPVQPRLARGHHAALPWKDAPAFMTALRARQAPAARCLEFVILTAARSGEALGATWGEIDLNAKLWTVPADRMKAGAVHVVPLSVAALALLGNLKPEANPQRSGPIFAINGAIRSNMAMAMLLRRMSYSHVTTHGFRSTFRDWAGDATSYPRELVEQALAHTIESKAERAYRRGTAIERRREMMEEWARYLSKACGVE